MMVTRKRWFQFVAIAHCCIWSNLSSAQVNVTTFHNDNARTGQNIQETALTPQNVNSSQFGRLFSVAVDGLVYAQPLYLAGISIGGTQHNVVYVGTEHDSLYAIDGDNGTVYWHISLLPANGRTVHSVADLGCQDLVPEIGITGTPVIDTNTGTIYLVAKSIVNGNYVQYLHAIDVSTAAEKFGGPVLIQGSVPGNTADGTGSVIPFDPKLHNQRAALLLENGHVVIGWSSHCDYVPWHGWVMSYNAGTLAQDGIYNTTTAIIPGGDKNGCGGIWMSGSGLAADASGNLYIASGNGAWNGTTDLSDSLIKLGPATNNTFPVLDYFTPYNQAAFASGDDDVGSGGLMLLPPTAAGRQLVVQMGKFGSIYLVDRTNMGKYCVTQTPACSNSDPQIVQEIPGATAGIWGSPAYWNGTIYWAGANDSIYAFSFDANGSGLISTSARSVSSQHFGFPGPTPAISANGASAGILWALDSSNYDSSCNSGTNCQTLYAYDATNLSTVLYTSNQAANNRDVPGGAVKFAVPVIANGKVYVGSQSTISAFGLLGNSILAASPTFSPAPGIYQPGQTVVIADATSGAVIHYTTDGTTPTGSSAIYTSPLAISATTTIQAIAVASGKSNSGVTAGTYSIGASFAQGTNSVALSSSDNLYGIVAAGNSVPNGGLDGGGHAYAAGLLGTTVTWSGATFQFGAAGALNAVSSTTIALPAGNYSSVELLATGVNGNQVNQTFVVTYTDGTSTSTTQNLSDWYTPQSYPGESTVLTMPYRVTANGATQSQPIYLYGYSIAIDGAKTVKSLTLPNNSNVVVLAVDVSAVGTVNAANLATADALYGIAATGSPVAKGGLDGAGHAYAGALLGTSVVWSGATFTLGAAGTLNAATSVTIPLPAGNYSGVQILATAVNGNQANQTFVVNYTDGTTTSTTQSLSDWYTPQNFPGESTVSSMPYRIQANGATQSGTVYLYGYSIAINNTKTLKSITLPKNPSVVVLAVNVSPPSASTPIGLSTVDQLYGIVSAGTPVANGGMDGGGHAYAAALIGTSVSWSGATFQLGAIGTPNAASSVTVAVPAGNYSGVELLATGVNGNQANQQFLLNYTDGTTTNVVQSLSDWYTPQNYAGESTVLTMPYRVSAAGGTQTRPIYLYTYTLPSNGAKSLKSITLPNNANVVVLAMNVAPANTVTSVKLAMADTLQGIVNTGSAIANGGLDGGGHAYAAALTGTSINWAGATFALGAAGALNAATNTTVPLPAGNYSTVRLLATGVNGNQANQAFVVNYTDGTSTTTTQSLSDWYTPQTYPSEFTVLTMPYRIDATGGTQARTIYLYGYSLAINNTKTVKNIVLPNTTNVVLLSLDLQR